jgi:esterase
MAASISDTLTGAAPERTVYVLHGILGSGRNWRSFARRWVERRPELRVLLVDQRHHGSAPHREASREDTVLACAEDLVALEAIHGAADVVVGHSFGGKVALAWSDLAGKASWALDSPPGAPAAVPDADRNDVLHILRTLQSTPNPAPDRQVLRDALEAAQIPGPLVNWLLTSSSRGPDGWRWQWNLEGVERLITDYFTVDLWRAAEAHRCQLVHAGRSDRWRPEELEHAARAAARGAIGWHELPNAGHWLHVDDPDGLLELLDRV